MSDHHDVTHEALSSLLADGRHVDNPEAMMSLFDSLHQDGQLHSGLDSNDPMSLNVNMSPRKMEQSFLDMTQDHDYRDTTSQHAPMQHQGQPQPQQHHQQQQHQQQQHQQQQHQQIPFNLSQADTSHIQRGGSSQPHLVEGMQSPAPAGAGAGESAEQQSEPFIRAPSPPNLGITIPAALSRLAESTQSIVLPSIDSKAFSTEILTERGEMGGKRKKQPHERAGWKEMDEQGLLKKRAAGSRKKQTIDEYAGYQPHEPIMGVGVGVGNNEASNNGSQQQQPQQQQHQQQQSQQQPSFSTDQHDLQGQSGSGHSADVQAMLADALPAGSQFGIDPMMDLSQGQGQDQSQDENAIQQDSGDGKRVSKTEQNRRAQQIYRRRREERMKKLEADAQALDATRKALLKVDELTHTLAFDYEASQIENAALKAALHSLAARGTAVLTSQNALPFPEGSDPMQSAATSADELNKVLEGLTSQSREIVKQRRGV